MSVIVQIRLTVKVSGFAVIMPSIACVFATSAEITNVLVAAAELADCENESEETEVKLIFMSVLVAVPVTSSNVATTDEFSRSVIFILVLQAGGEITNSGTLMVVAVGSLRRLSIGLVIWLAGFSAVIKQGS
jgi:hypothetical protein